MSYHEYTDQNGNLRRRHYNGHRFPEATQLKLYKPGDEPFTEYRARATLDKFYLLVGGLAYKAWWERTFEIDGKTADDFTWQQILEAAQLEVDHPSECGCVLPEQACVICVSLAHVLSVAETEPGS